MRAYLYQRMSGWKLAAGENLHVLVEVVEPLFARDRLSTNELLLQILGQEQFFEELRKLVFKHVGSLCKGKKNKKIESPSPKKNSLSNRVSKKGSEKKINKQNYIRMRTVNVTAESVLFHLLARKRQEAALDPAKRS